MTDDPTELPTGGGDPLGVGRMQDVEDIRRAYMKMVRVADIGRHFETPVPAEFNQPYTVTETDWTGMSRPPQGKYLNRKRNLRRAMNRIQLFLPELLGGAPKRIFELSTAHGAILEVLRHYGHEVMGNDYVNMVSGDTPEQRAIYRRVNDPGFVRDKDDYGLPIPSGDQIVDWPYRPIIDSIGIPMALFDAGRTPYPLEAQSFDYVLSMQAIEHYCHPQDWMTIVDEMCRIARQGVFLLLNPMMPEMTADPVYAQAFHKARADLRDFDRHGFRCVGCHLHWGQALGFKLMRL
jgi:hypothetical protein